jgi:cytidyltransferase-like protein
MQNKPSISLTFGRFNLPHPGHVDLIRKMLSVADVAYVGISISKSNNDFYLRKAVLESLCKHAEIPIARVMFVSARNPFEFVQDFTTANDNITVVLGVDQSLLGNVISDRLGVKFVPNEVRIGSSTVIRHFLKSDEMIVREIYHDDALLYSAIKDLRSQELDREKS